MKQKIDHLENAHVLKTEEIVRLTEENKILEERFEANSFAFLIQRDPSFYIQSKCISAQPQKVIKMYVQKLFIIYL